MELWEEQNRRVFAGKIFECSILLFLLESWDEVLTHPPREAIIFLDSFLTFPRRERKWQVIRGKYATGPPSWHGRRVLPTPNLSTLVFPAQAKYTEVCSEWRKRKGKSFFTFSRNVFLFWSISQINYGLVFLLHWWNSCKCYLAHVRATQNPNMYKV